METCDMRQAYLLKIGLCFTVILSFYACTSREERTSSIKTEIKLLRDSMEVNTRNALEPRLQEKNKLEDTLHTYNEPFKRRIALLNKKILSTEKEFRKELRIAKGQHFSKHGHNPSSQGSLNRIIDNLVSQKEKEVMGYQAEISRIEESYKSNLFYLQTTKRIALLESELEEINRRISQRFKMRIKKLEEDTLVGAIP